MTGAEWENPTETFWAAVAWLGIAPWVFKAGCALVTLIFVYRLPRHWEQGIMFIGLGCIVASPWFPPAGPIGDWLVFPAMALMTARSFYERKPALEAKRAAEGPPPLEAVITNTLKMRRPRS